MRKTPLIKIDQISVTFDPAGGAPADRVIRLIEFNTPYGFRPLISRLGFKLRGWFLNDSTTEVTPTKLMQLPFDHIVRAEYIQSIFYRDSVPVLPQDGYGRFQNKKGAGRTCSLRFLGEI